MLHSWWSAYVMIPVNTIRCHMLHMFWMALSLPVLTSLQLLGHLLLVKIYMRLLPSCDTIWFHECWVIVFPSSHGVTAHPLPHEEVEEPIAVPEQQQSDISKRIKNKAPILPQQPAIGLAEVARVEQDHHAQRASRFHHFRRCKPKHEAPVSHLKLEGKMVRMKRNRGSLLHINVAFLICIEPDSPSSMCTPRCFVLLIQAAHRDAE